MPEIITYPTDFERKLRPAFISHLSRKGYALYKSSRLLLCLHVLCNIYVHNVIQIVSVWFWVLLLILAYYSSQLTRNPYFFFFYPLCIICIMTEMLLKALFCYHFVYRLLFLTFFEGTLPQKSLFTLCMFRARISVRDEKEVYKSEFRDGVRETILNL